MRLVPGDIRLITILTHRYGLSQRDIAHRLAVSDATVSMWYSGKRCPNAQHLAALGALADVMKSEEEHAADDGAGVMLPGPE